jgi:beta-phosphoglucomutase-like phosphatase (HAD superfamily)
MDFTTGLAQSFARFIHPPLLEKERAHKMFLMFDLDGTLVDSDRLHYESYKHALGSDLSWGVFEKHINTGSIDRMLEECGVSDLEHVKQRKKTHFLTHSAIQFMPGAEELLEHCLQEKINFAIVTNTSAAIVEHFKSKLPLLQRVTQWVVREDYVAAKPSDECYALALAKYYKGEPYTIGFENTIHGYHAIRNHCQCVYFVTNKDSCNYDCMKTQDVYLCKHLVAKNTA